MEKHVKEGRTENTDMMDGGMFRLKAVVNYGIAFNSFYANVPPENFLT